MKSLAVGPSSRKSSCYLPGLLACLIAACAQPEAVVQQEEASVPPPLSVVLVDLPEVADEIARQWTAQTGGEIQTNNVSVAELFEQDYDAVSGDDIIVYPGQILGQLVEDEKIYPLGDEFWNSEQLASRSLLRHHRTTLIRFDRERWAMSVGNPTFMLLIRKDVLDAVNLSPPESWEQLIEIATRLSQAEQVVDSDGKELPTRVAIPSARGWAADALLAIAASSVRHRGKLNSVFDRRSMKPLINQQPFIRALEHLNSLLEDSQEMSPENVAQLFFSGNLAIGVSWPGNAFLKDVMDDEELTGLHGRMLLSRLPGDTQWFDFADQEWRDSEGGIARVDLIGFDCRLASVLRSTRHPNQAFGFLAWLSGKRTVATIFSKYRFASPTRAGHLGDPLNWTGAALDQQTADDYSDLLKQINEEPVFLTFPRIRGSHRYLQALEDSIQRFLSGELEAEGALQQAADAWESITEEYGRDAQIKLFRQDQPF